MSQISVWVEQRENSRIRTTFQQFFRTITVAAVLITFAACAVIIFTGNRTIPLMCEITPLIFIAVLGIHIGLNRTRPRNRIKMSSVFRVNAHAAEAIKHLPHRYGNLISEINPMTKKNKQTSAVILRSVMESLLAIGACEKTGEKRKKLNGELQERVLISEAYAAISDDGRGYVLIEPFGRETSIVHNAGSAPVAHALRHAGLDWDLEQVSYDDDIALFLLYDPHFSRAFDLSRNPSTMFEAAKKLATSSNERWTIPLQPGLDWNIAKSPHAIISGSTGSGKSYLSNYLIALSAIKGCYLILADPKRSDLSAMADFMPEHRVSHDPSGILKLVQNAVEIMTKRYELMDSLRRERKELFQSDFSQYGFCPVLLVVEELASLVSALDRSSRNEFDSLIKRITLQGRQAGVGLVSIMQQPNASNIATESRSQTGLRIMLGNATQSEYRMLFGDNFVLSTSAQGVGRGYCSVLGETCGPVRFEAPKLDQKQIADMMSRALSAQININPLACMLDRSGAREEHAARPEDRAHQTTTCAPVPSATQIERRE